VGPRGGYVRFGRRENSFSPVVITSNENTLLKIMQKAAKSSFGRPTRPSAKYVGFIRRFGGIPPPTVQLRALLLPSRSGVEVGKGKCAIRCHINYTSAERNLKTKKKNHWLLNHKL